MEVIEELKNNKQSPVVIADHQGLIKFINSIFEDIFYWTAQEIINQHLSIIIPKSLHDAHHLGFSRFLVTGKPTLLDRPIILSAVKKNGDIFKAEHIIHASHVSGNWLFGATITPILAGDPS
ncbi:MAG: PAS domain-containing protein [Gammaproteobacteria bacterium]|nr:PAS domain-containing protein [Gammaproteobacteria bacterium]